MLSVYKVPFVPLFTIDSIIQTPLGFTRSTQTKGIEFERIMTFHTMNEKVSLSSAKADAKLTFNHSQCKSPEYFRHNTYSV